MCKPGTREPTANIPDEIVNAIIKCNSYGEQRVQATVTLSEMIEVMTRGHHHGGARSTEGGLPRNGRMRDSHPTKAQTLRV